MGDLRSSLRNAAYHALNRTSAVQTEQHSRLMESSVNRSPPRGNAFYVAYQSRLAQKQPSGGKSVDKAQREALQRTSGLHHASGADEAAEEDVLRDASSSQNNSFHDEHPTEAQATAWTEEGARRKRKKNEYDRSDKTVHEPALKKKKKKK